MPTLLFYPTDHPTFQVAAEEEVDADQKERELNRLAALRGELLTLVDDQPTFDLLLDCINGVVSQSAIARSAKLNRSTIKRQLDKYLHTLRLRLLTRNDLRHLHPIGDCLQKASA